MRRGGGATQPQSTLGLDMGCHRKEIYREEKRKRSKNEKEKEERGKDSKGV